MSDREFRQKIRTLQQQVGLLVQQVSRLENIVGDLNPGVAMPKRRNLLTATVSPFGKVRPRAWIATTPTACPQQLPTTS